MTAGGGGDRGSLSRGGRGADRRVLAAILLVTAVVYSSAIANGFVYDDHRLIERNAAIRDLHNVAAAFGQDLSGGVGWRIYRPLPAISFMVDHALWGLRPAGYHVVNLLWHLLSVSALFVAVREFGAATAVRSETRSGAQGRDESRPIWIPAAVALLLAVHPINSEAVFWVSRRGDLMAAAFSFAAIATCVRWLRTGHLHWLATTLGLSAAALLSKEIAVALPGILTATVVLILWRALSGPGLRSTRGPHSDRAPQRDRRAGSDQPTRPAWRLPGRVSIIVGGLVLWLLIPLYALLRWRLFGSVSEQPLTLVQNWLLPLEGGERLLALLGVLGRYMMLLLCPLRLSADYSYRSLALPQSALSASVLLGIGTLAAAVVLTAWGLRRCREPIVVQGLVIAAAAYLPVSNWIVPIGVVLAERLFYIPCAGISIAAAGLVAHALDRRRPGHSRRLVGGIALVVLLSFSIRTHFRGMDWRDDLTLFRSVVTVFPENVVARTYQAIGLRARGDLDGAEREYQAALAVFPEYHLARVNLALLHLERGEAESAAAAARWIIERDPVPGPAHLVLGRASALLGETAVAERELRLAARDPATRVDALMSLAELYRSLGDAESASWAAREARRAGAGWDRPDRTPADSPR